MKVMPAMNSDANSTVHDTIINREYNDRILHDPRDYDRLSEHIAHLWKRQGLF